MYVPETLCCRVRVYRMSSGLTFDSSVRGCDVFRNMMAGRSDDIRYSMSGPRLMSANDWKHGIIQ